MVKKAPPHRVSFSLGSKLSLSFPPFESGVQQYSAAGGVNDYGLLAEIVIGMSEYCPGSPQCGADRATGGPCPVGAYKDLPAGDEALLELRQHRLRGGVPD